MLHYAFYKLFGTIPKDGAYSNESLQQFVTGLKHEYRLMSINVIRTADRIIGGFLVAFNASLNLGRELDVGRVGCGVGAFKTIQNVLTKTIHTFVVCFSMVNAQSV
jgi:hypothetical protein